MTICIKRLACICFLFFTLISCEKNEIAKPTDNIKDSLSTEPSELSIFSAKTWFEHEYLVSQRTTETETSKKLVRKVFWEQAYMDKMSNGQDLLIIPLEYHEPDKVANADTYLWIFYDDNNQFSAKVIEYLSSTADRVKGNEISIFNFSGAMSVRDWNGTLLNGFTFKDGKPEGLLLSVNGIETQRVNDAKSGRKNGTVCNDVYFTRSTCTSYLYKICENGNCSELRPNDTPTFCSYYEFRINQCYWVADFPGQTNPYVGGTGNITARSASELTMTGLSHPSIDISKFIKCFGVIDANSTYKVTIYDEEPSPGTGAVVKGTNVGHTFIGLEKNTNGFVTRQVVGFYPNMMSGDWVGSHMADNAGDPHTVSVTFEPTPDDFQKAITAVAKQQTQQYHYAKYNCTAAATAVCTAMNVTFPKNESSFPFTVAKGLSPGQLGKDLRNHQSSGILNTTKGTGPSSKGPCN